MHVLSLVTCERFTANVAEASKTPRPASASPCGRWTTPGASFWAPFHRQDSCTFAWPGSSAGSTACCSQGGPGSCATLAWPPSPKPQMYSTTRPNSTLLNLSKVSFLVWQASLSCIRASVRVNLPPQNSQLKGFSPVWVTAGLLKLSFLLNLLLYSVQYNTQSEHV